jgi:hypothetical protein
MVDEKIDNGETTGFVPLLRTLGDGMVEGDVSTALKKLVQELSDYALHYSKGKGKLTLVLDVVVEQGGTADIRATVTTKAPKVSRPKTLAWITKDGTLSSKNPKQLELGEIRMVSLPKMKEVVEK